MSSFYKTRDMFGEGPTEHLSNGRPMHATASGMSDAEFKRLGLKPGKHVKSTDPIKRSVVRALKEISSSTKVTLVLSHGNGVYSGDCMIAPQKGGEALRLGRFVVELIGEQL
jgi:hypothetical protein